MDVICPQSHRVLLSLHRICEAVYLRDLGKSQEFRVQAFLSLVQNGGIQIFWYVHHCQHFHFRAGYHMVSVVRVKDLSYNNFYVGREYVANPKHIMNQWHHK